MKPINYKGYLIDRDLLTNTFTVFSGLKKLETFSTMKECFAYIDGLIE